MSQSRRFRQTVAPAAGLYPANRRLQANPVADRYVYRFNAGPGTQDCPDYLFTVEEFGITAGFYTRLFMAAAQPRLGAADGGYIQEKPQVRGKSHAPRVGYSLPVHHNNVRRYRKLLAGCQYQRRFTERKQPRYIGERYTVGDHLDFYYLQVGIAQDDDRPGARLRPPVHRDINAGNQAWGRDIAGARDFGRELFLKSYGFGGGDLPAMPVDYPHTLIIDADRTVDNSRTRAGDKTTKIPGKQIEAG